MKPIFTVHAGEYLVADAIEKKFPKYFVWLPSRDTGIDLLLTNENNSKAVSLQVKFSKDFNATHVKESFRKDIRGTGWWALNKTKIEKSKADFWIFILYSFEKRSHDFVILKPSELLSIFKKTNRSGKILHCYITITNHKTAFETRGLGEKERILIFENNFHDSSRDLTRHLNNWKQVEQKLK